MPYRLKSPALLNPFWFNQVKSGIHEGKAISSNKIELKGEILEVLNRNDIELTTGEKVFVWLDRYFYFKTEKEKMIEEENIRQQKEKEYQLKYQHSIKLREEAEKFNSQFNIPVKWTVEFKTVLSGLTENSNGSGTNKRTVYHIMLLEDLNEGRLKRKAGNFLCTSKSNNDGKFSELRNWDGSRNMRTDMAGNLYLPKITCKQCLKIAERWKNKN